MRAIEIRDRVALVTGGSAGIGHAVALRLADAGARVMVHGRDRERTLVTARSIHGAALFADLSQPDAGADLAAQALAEVGTVDLLVVCAGFGWSGPLTQMPPEHIDEMVRVDLLAPLRLVRALLPQMVERGSGHVVLVSSVAGRAGVAGEAVYAACKAGLDAFADSLRLELEDTDVGISVVIPGAVRTAFFDRRGRPYRRRIPRPVAADAVARSIVATIRGDRAEAWVPGWLRVVPVIRALAPRSYRRLAARYGEPVRVGSHTASGHLL